MEYEEVNLFNRLRALRREIALRENLPPYMIFADSTLREMVQVCPVDRRAMIRISGVGERKLDKYGDEFLERIRSFIKEIESGGILDGQGRSKIRKDKSQVEINQSLGQNDTQVDSMRPQQMRNLAKFPTERVPSHHQTFLLY